jgi:TatD DNase family protein
VKEARHYPAQEAVFSYCLDAAEGNGKIVNVHTTGAEAEVLDHLKARQLPGVIIHWYSGPLALVDEFIELGSFFTIGVEVLRSSHIQELARSLPVERILTGTDNPGGWQWMDGRTGLSGTPWSGGISPG